MILRDESADFLQMLSYFIAGDLSIGEHAADAGQEEQSISENSLT